MIFMTMISSILGMLLQILFVFALSPLLVGVIRKVKAYCQGRSGSPIIQPYFDLIKLFSKGTVKSSISSWIFLATPILIFASTVAAALLLPIFRAVPPFAADIIIFVYLFAIGRLVVILSGLDAGSGFGGIGASRESLYSVLIEPVLFAAVLFLVLFSGSTNLTIFTANGPNNWFGILGSPIFYLSAVALFILMLAEMGRLPFDNPATHLELTMVHEAMILENSGPGLGLIEWAQASKMFLFFILFANLFFPLSLFNNPLTRAGAVLASALFLGIVTAIVESFSVKVRLFKVAELLVFALAMAVLAFLIHISSDPNANGAIPLLLALMVVSNLYFLFGATFRRRIEIYLLQNVALSVIFVFIAIKSGSVDSYLRLAVTVILKVIILPILIYRIFSQMAKGENLLNKSNLTPEGITEVLKHTNVKLRTLIDNDPLFIDAPVTTTTALVISVLLISVSFLVGSNLISGIALPIALSIILIGLLIISTKTHILLQMLGFLIMENGIVLLPVALGVDIPLISEAITLFDILVLVVVSVVLALKIRSVAKTVDTGELAELTEKR